MPTRLYFAYGSNLLHERLAARCPGVVCAGRAVLPGHALHFGKVGADGSGKCGFFASAGAELPGVLWRIGDAELACLDRIEGVGHGYRRSTVEVRPESGPACTALTYLASGRDDRVLPFEWYLALVIAGAEQQALPRSHVEMLREVAFRIDPVAERPGRMEALEVLGRSGYQQLGHALVQPYLAAAGAPSVADAMPD
jgi:gamma-glutamylcyclotransferase